MSQPFHSQNKLQPGWTEKKKKPNIPKTCKHGNGRNRCLCGGECLNLCTCMQLSRSVSGFTKCVRCTVCQQFLVHRTVGRTQQRGSSIKAPGGGKSHNSTGFDPVRIKPSERALQFYPITLGRCQNRAGEARWTQGLIWAAVLLLLTTLKCLSGNYVYQDLT